MDNSDQSGIELCAGAFRVPLWRVPAGTAIGVREPFSIGGQAPEWIEVMPAGSIEARDGRTFVNDNPRAVIAAIEALGMEAGLPIDYDHAIDLAAPKGMPARAAGWMEEFRMRDGAIFARVEWTEAGRRAVAAGEWRYISPVFDYSRKTGRVTRILRAALTNNPALYETAIAARQTNKDPEGSRPARARKENVVEITDDARKIAAAFGLRPEDLVRGAAGLRRPRETFGLTPDQLAIARNAGMSPRALARELCVRTKNATTLAAATLAAGRSPTAEMMRAHQEVDRAHEAAYGDADDHGDAWAKAPDGELLKIALSELQAFDLGDEEKTYPQLLNAALHVMALLGRCAPAYADIED